MSFKRKLISGIVSAFAVVSFTTFAAAQDSSSSSDSQNSTQKQERRERRNGWGKRNGGGKFGKGMRRGFGMRGLRQLNLTDAQKEQVRSIMQANRPDKAQFEAIRPLIEAKRNGTITEDQKAQLKAFRQERKQKGEQIRSQILNVLTAEQRTQLEQLEAERKQRRELRKQQRQERRNQQKTDSDDIN